MPMLGAVGLKPACLLTWTPTDVDNAGQLHPAPVRVPIRQCFAHDDV